MLFIHSTSWYVEPPTIQPLRLLLTFRQLPFKKGVYSSLLELRLPSELQGVTFHMGSQYYLPPDIREHGDTYVLLNLDRCSHYCYCCCNYSNFYCLIFVQPTNPPLSPPPSYFILCAFVEKSECEFIAGRLVFLSHIQHYRQCNAPIVLLYNMEHYRF